MIKYTGVINVEKGNYGITLLTELEGEESVIFETFYLTNKFDIL